MSESNETSPSANNAGNRRRTVLLALLGAGAPLAHRTLPGEWIAPVVNSVILPVHAQTSPDPGVDTPVGNFGPGADMSKAIDSSLFDNIAQRSEQEILDLFISAAEAGTCSVPDSSCDSAAAVMVEVAATINDNPSNNECVQARVTVNGDAGSGCTFCTIIDFEAAVDGKKVTVSENCGLGLTDMTLTGSNLDGSWSYKPSGSAVEQTGTFNSPRDEGGGCGSLTCET